MTASNELTIADIARTAGVSRSTVSRVINNHPDVNQETRQKILQVIDEHGFHPNLAARALVIRKTRIISLVITEAIASAFEDPFYSILIQGISAAAKRHNYAVMLWIGNEAEEEEQFCNRILSYSLIDGVLAVAVPDNSVMMSRLSGSSFPMVLIGKTTHEEMNFLNSDNIGGAQAAVSHLINLGRQRIGIITGSLYASAAVDRLDGYKSSLQEHGYTIDDDLIVEGGFTEISGYEGMKNLIQAQADAVFTSSDVMARGALRAIHEAGLSVPQDIALVSFDDMPFAAETTPALTTVRQDIFELGASAFEVLLDVMNNPDDSPRQQVIPTTLIIRESCGSTQNSHKTG